MPGLQNEKFCLYLKDNSNTRMIQSVLKPRLLHSYLKKGAEKLWLTWQMFPAASLWNGKHTTELKEARVCVGTRKSLSLSSFGRVVLFCSPSLLLSFLYWKKRKACSVGAPKYEIQFSFPQTVFLLKSLLSWLADGPASSTLLGCESTYCTNWEGGRTSDIERLREREGGHRVWTRHQRIETVCSKTTEGLNLPERQLSLLCNLTRTCLNWAWSSTPARPSAPNQFHIGHRKNYFSELFELGV